MDPTTPTVLNEPILFQAECIVKIGSYAKGPYYRYTTDTGLFHAAYKNSTNAVSIVVFLIVKIILPFSIFSTIRKNKHLSFNVMKIP